MNEKLQTGLENNGEIEIDLRELFFALRRKIVLILVCGLAFGLAAGAYTKLFMVPVYTSTSSMLVLSKETTLTSIADLQLGTQLTNDYRVLIKSTPVLEQVIENLKLDMTAAGLAACITIENPSDTRILELTAKNTDPVMAKNIVDQVAEVSSVYVGDKMEVIPPKIIEQGKIPVNYSSPNLKKNAFLGLLLGMILCAGVIAVYTIMDDTVKTEEDITKYLGISTLAVVPDRKDFINEQRKKERKKR